MKAWGSNTRTRNEGFSLVEVLVAATLLSLSVCWSVVLTMQSRKLSSLAEETNVAVEILESQFAECMSLSREGLTGEVLTPNTELDLDAILDGQTLLFETPGFNPGEEVPEVLEFRLTLTWLSVDDRERTISVGGLKR